MHQNDLELNTSAKRNILVLGASGFIGQHLLMSWGDLAIGTHKSTLRRNTIYFDPLTMDLAAINGIEQCSHAVILYGEREPDICYMQPQKTHALNVESTKRVISQCQSLGIVPVFASSEMVFSGEKGMYEESDDPDPILVYGSYKVEVEKFLVANVDDYLIFRLAKVMGAKRNDRSIFSNWLDHLESSSNRKIRCAQDQFFSLIAVTDVAIMLRALIEGNETGIFHFSDGVRHNRLELLELFLAEYERKTKLKFTIEPVSINDFSLPEIRPLDLSLSSKKLSLVNTSGYRTALSCIRNLTR